MTIVPAILIVLALLATILSAGGCVRAQQARQERRAGKSTPSASTTTSTLYDDTGTARSQTPGSTEPSSPPASGETTTTTTSTATETAGGLQGGATTRRPAQQGVVGTSPPQPPSASTAIAQRTLRVGSSGDDVVRLQQRLTELGYLPGAADGRFSAHTRHAVVAFQKVNGLGRDGVAGPKTLQALANPKTVVARYKGSHIEVDKTLQVLLVVKDGAVERIISASTGAGGRGTPSVQSAVDWKAGHIYVSRKYGGTMVWSSFFYGGVAVHGFSSVPAYPASHGCVRIPIPDSKYVYDNMPIGSMVYVY